MRKYFVLTAFVAASICGASSPCTASEHEAERAINRCDQSCERVVDAMQSSLAADLVSAKKRRISVAITRSPTFASAQQFEVDFLSDMEHSLSAASLSADKRRIAQLSFPTSVAPSETQCQSCMIEEFEQLLRAAAEGASARRVAYDARWITNSSLNLASLPKRAEQKSIP